MEDEEPVPPLVADDPAVPGRLVLRPNTLFEEDNDDVWLLLLAEEVEWFLRKKLLWLFVFELLVLAPPTTSTHPVEDPPSAAATAAGGPPAALRGPTPAPVPVVLPVWPVVAPEPEEDDCFFDVFVVEVEDDVEIFEDELGVFFPPDGNKKEEFLLEFLLRGVVFQLVVLPIAVDAELEFGREMKLFGVVLVHVLVLGLFALVNKILEVLLTVDDSLLLLAVEEGIRPFVLGMRRPSSSSSSVGA